MKKLLLLTVLFIGINQAQAAVVVPVSWVNAVAAAGTAEQLNSTGVYAHFACIAPADNTGNMVIGNDGANDVTTSNGVILVPGGVYNSPNICKSGLNCLDVSNFYIDAATSADEVQCIGVKYQ